MEELEFRRPMAGEERELAELRARAMRESLEAAGRFDEQRVRRRFLDTYHPDLTWVVHRGGVTRGFYVAEPRDDHLFLAHLYVEPEFQGQGIGRRVLEHLRSEEPDRPIRLNALKGSRSNDFYRRHGFVRVGEDEFDWLYEAAPGKGRR